MMLEDKMLGYEVRVMNGLWRMKENVKEKVHDFFTTEDGDTNFISIIIVLVIVVALAVVFRKNIKALVNGMWKSIFKDAEDAVNGGGKGVTFEGTTGFDGGDVGGGAGAGTGGSGN